MMTGAANHLQRMQEEVRRAADEHDRMRDAVGRYLEGIPGRVPFGRPAQRSTMQSRMLRHLTIRETHLEGRRHALGLDYDLASMGYALEGICPVCDVVTRPAAEPACPHMV